MELPKKYKAQEVEDKWQKFWAEKKIYAFDPKSDREVFSIDTPPPYASADHLHVGHGMHYSQFEFVSRYQKMKGKNVFFPMGFDDNGLPTEKFVEKKHNLNKSKITRTEFRKLCLEESKKAGKTYFELFNSLGFSLDWSLLYQTIGEKARRVSQKSFLDLYRKERLRRIDAPTVWCTHCQTSIAQAEFENVELSSHFSDIKFACGDQELVISTTRPEMLPACVGLFYHPEDEKYKSLKGKTAKVPLFNHDVPILEDENVDMEKGTGLMMVCTFGDKEDVEKWHRHKLPLRIVFEEHGRMNELASKYAGMKIKEARPAILEDLKSKGYLLNQKEITHAVNVHERCGTEIEFLKKLQWEIKVLDKKDELLEIAKKINWYPKHMKLRYEHWVKNLQWDWGISRQRYYGVPFPVWYCDNCNEVILAKEENLPVDPIEDKPPCSECPKCGHDKLVPETDVMDTWMTSSVSPEINADWDKKHLLPMSLRPQAHDIIRTWAFYTIVKSYFHHENIPWKDVMISGHGQDPHGKKMSKSKGNFVVAQDVIKKYSADAFRYWASTVKLGEDLPYQEKDVVTGNKTVVKIFNACKFAVIQLKGYDGKIPTEFRPIDKWILSKLQGVIETSTQNFDVYEYSKSKVAVDQFFWQSFCDNYLEIVKDRLYNTDKYSEEDVLSGQYALYQVSLNILKMFAPLMPFITEEAYHFFYDTLEDAESIHLTSWPEVDKNLIDEDAEKAGDLFVDILASVRRFKSQNNVSLKAPIKELKINCDPMNEDLIQKLEQDLKTVTHASKVSYVKEGTDLECDKYEIKLGVELDSTSSLS
jgi:valyl-tRNA synthetase